MAFPQVRSSAGTNTAVNGTSKTINLPATVVAGDRLLIALVCDGVPTITWPGGYTQRKTLNGAQVTLYVAEKDTPAAGTEGGTTISITLSATEMHAARSWSISASDTSVLAEYSTGYNPGVNSANPDPDALTPSWGADDTLWIAFEGYDVGTSTVTAYPTNYASNQANDRGNAAAGAGLGVASRELNAASENPGTFTNSASSRAVAVTIGIKPVAAGGTTHNAAATINGVSSLTAAGLIQKLGSATIASTSSLTATGNEVFAAAATINGVSSLTAAGLIEKLGSATIASTSSLTAAATVEVAPITGEATINGTSSLTAAGLIEKRAAATVNGVSTLTATGNEVYAAVATINGASSLTAAGLIEKLGSATINGVSSLTAAGTVVTPGDTNGAATITGVSTLTATGTIERNASATVASTSSLTAGGTVERNVAATIAGTSSLTASGLREALSEATIIGTSSLTALANAIYSATTVITGTSDLTAIATVMRPVGAETYWQEGFLRDKGTGLLLVTTDLTGATWQNGFLRSPDGWLVVNPYDGSEPLMWQDGMLRDAVEDSLIVP